VPSTPYIQKEKEKETHKTLKKSESLWKPETKDIQVLHLYKKIARALLSLYPG
jgi:hypothetical protein